MMMRQLPALCAGVLMLAACADSSGTNQAIPPQSPEVSMPGEIMGDDDAYNIGNTIYFAFDSAELVIEAQTQLQEAAKWLQQYPQQALTIEGHADEYGTREYNLALGERRADAVMRYLTALGIDPSRMKTVSYGKERPVCIEANEACWSQNRRSVYNFDD